MTSIDLKNLELAKQGKEFCITQAYYKLGGNNRATLDF